MELKSGECIIVSADEGKNCLCPGALIRVCVPGKWMMFMHPDHPAYIDCLLEELPYFPTDALKMFMDERMPQIAREYAKIELNKRKG